MNRQNEDFISLCKEFETLVRSTYGLADKDSPYYYVAGLDDFSDVQEQLHMIRNLRNLLVHNRTEYNREPALTVQDTAVDLLNDIMNRIENPRKARDVMVQEIFWGRPEQTVQEMLDLMKAHDISRIPIEKDGRLVGVFSEHSLFRRLISNKPLKREETIAEYLEEIRLDHPAARRYEFCKPEDPVWQLEARFFEKSAKRLEMLFVQDARHKVKGIITIYDLAREDLQ